MQKTEQLQTVKVFVYGTLKKGECRENVISHSASRWVRAAILGFDIWDLGAFPCITHGEDNRQVFGELVEFPVDCAEDVIRRLDSIEGYREGSDNNLYDRKVVEVIELGNGRKTNAFVYVFSREMNDRAPIVPSGNWVRGEKW